MYEFSVFSSFYNQAYKKIYAYFVKKNLIKWLSNIVMFPENKECSF